MKKNLLRLTSMLLAFALMSSAVVLGAGGVQPAGYTASAAAQQTKDGTVSVVSTVKEAMAILAKGEKVQLADNTKASEKKDGVLTKCEGKCGHSPAIIIHGIGQSETYALDENGKRKLDKNGKEITVWPFSVDTDYITKTLAGPLLKTLITQKDKGLSDTVAQVVKQVFAANASGLDGKHTSGVELVRYPNSVARCTPKEKEFIYNSMRFQSYTQVAGEDHLYYFAYDSFGNNLSIAEELYNYIQHVKDETGHDKVDLVPVSLGGTIANSLLEYYPQVYSELNRVIYIVPALDGSNIVGDIYTNNLSLDDQMLYKELFPSFTEGYIGYLINILIRVLPKDVVHAVLDKAVNSLMDTALVNCTVMWSLVPSSYYPAAAAKWLSDPAHAEIKRQTDLYYQAQLNSRKNIQKLVDSGVSVFDIVDYNEPLYAIAGSYDECNSDGVIHLDSTSMGATSGLVDTPLPAGYKQQNTHCSNTAHNHISPDGIVDASTGLLPDNTFYFRNQHHEGTGRNDVIIKLATELMLNDNFTSVYSMPERFPQFNVGREARGFTGDVANAKLIDQSKLSPENATELQAAIEQADAMLNNTIVDYDAYLAARDRLYAILVKIGEREAPKDTSKDDAMKAICKFISDNLYTFWGPRGFSDWK